MYVIVFDLWYLFISVYLFMSSYIACDILWLYELCKHVQAALSEARLVKSHTAT